MFRIILNLWEEVYANNPVMADLLQTRHSPEFRKELNLAMNGLNLGHLRRQHHFHQLPTVRELDFNMIRCEGRFSSDFRHESVDFDTRIP